MKSCLGGTFDHLHKGHEALLHAAFAKSEFVLIGLTSDKYANTNHKYKASLETYMERKAALTNFLYANNYLEKAKVEQIQDSVGTATKYNDLKTIFCTSDTTQNAEKVNRWRLMRALPSLRVQEVPLVLAEDGLSISSERIRRGIIDREGKVLKWMPSKVGYSLK